MNDDLIYRGVLIKKAQWMEMPDNQGIYYDVQAVPMSSIELAPAVDAVEVVHGEWICHEIEDTLRWKECPVCRFEIPNVNYNYCPNCGADMRERKKNNE